MGIFDDIGDFFGSTTEYVVHVGTQSWTAAVDFEERVVTLAGQVWREIPGELFAPGLGPLAGILKNKTEDELFMMLGPSGIVAGVGVFPVQFDRAAQEIIGGLALVGAIKHRTLNDEEWRMARWVFGGQLPPRGSIHLTNFGIPQKGAGLFDRAIVFPAIADQIYVNMGAKYCHRSTTEDGATLLHELTHVWQLRNKLIRDLQILAALDRRYAYRLGGQWRDYAIEQQATIVQDWANGTVECGKAHTAGPLSIGSPLFRYIHRNVRRNDNGADSATGSIRELAGASTTDEVQVSSVHPAGPGAWWPTFPD